MGIINKRNAVFGWGVWTVAKSVGKRKARAAAPKSGGHSGLKKGAIASIAAAVGGALWFRRKKSEDTPSSGS